MVDVVMLLFEVVEGSSGVFFNGFLFERCVECLWSFIGGSVEMLLMFE